MNNNRVGYPLWPTKKNKQTGRHPEIKMGQKEEQEVENMELKTNSKVNKDEAKAQI